MPTLFTLETRAASGLGTGGVSGELLKLSQAIVGQSVVRPNGSLAGHNTGSPIEDLAYQAFTKAFGTRVHRQYEVLNAILSNRPDVKSARGRKSLFGRISVQDLLCSGRNLQKWSGTSLFVEAQGDTADFVLFHDGNLSLMPGCYDLIDVKSVNVKGSSQPPNIISGTKLFNAMANSVVEGAVASDIVYLAIGYLPNEKKLDVVQSRAISLFKIKKMPYINWTAGSQIQFNPFEVDQDFTGTPLEWANQFMDHYLLERGSKIAKDTKQLSCDRARVRSLRTSQ
jgi:hypothetical protein